MNNNNIQKLSNNEDSQICDCETPIILDVVCLSFTDNQIVISLTVDQVISNSTIQVEILDNNNEVVQNYENLSELELTTQILNIDISNLSNVKGVNVRIKTNCLEGQYYCVRLKTIDSNSDTDSNSDSSSDSINTFQLFDKSSWVNAVPQPYLNYLNQAADRWSIFIRYNQSYYEQIQQIIQDSDNLPENWNNLWNGLRLNSDSDFQLRNDLEESVVASCGPSYFIPINIGVKIYPLSFRLNINNFYSNFFSPEDWVNILTHELGHALGIGVFWSPEYQDYGALPPVDNFLNGSAYINAQDGYNNITDDTFIKVPLESSGGSGTISSHWENDFRLSSSPGSEVRNYPGLQNELMIGFVNPVSNGGMIISELSIKTLVDFGFEEVNPGSSEGVPTLNNSQSLSTQNSLIKLNCNCEFHGKMRSLGEFVNLNNLTLSNIEGDSDISSNSESCDTFCIHKDEYDSNIHELINIYNSIEECSNNCLCDSDSDSCDSCEDCVAACADNLEDPPWDPSDCIEKTIFSTAEYYIVDDKADDLLPTIGTKINIPKKLMVHITGVTCPNINTTIEEPYIFEYTDNGYYKINNYSNVCVSNFLSNPYSDPPFGYITINGLAFNGGPQISGSSVQYFYLNIIFNNMTLYGQIKIPIRYREIYNDWVFAETVTGSSRADSAYRVQGAIQYCPSSVWGNSFGGVNCTPCQDSTCIHPFTDEILITISAENTCRPSEPCPEPSICRNIVELSSLEQIPGPCDKCYCDGGGRPLDIDVHCDGTVRPADDYFPSTNETFTLYFDPRGLSAVPVIENIIYDTTTLDANNDIVRVHTTSTASEMREWVCKNLRFVTVKDYSKLQTDTANAVESNWPYNDLYWAATCSGYETLFPNDTPINLVPC